ncbi:MAG: TatD family hydrolase [Actinomycetota bacterium]|nr:TatD family hydrolase [Actinomycetota bacterium]
MVKGPVELPRVGAPTADTHAHLDMLDDPAGALERAAVMGVVYILTIADVTESPRATYEHLPNWLAVARQRLDDWDVPRDLQPHVRVVVGAHPHNAKDYDDAAEKELLALLDEPETVGVGEIGLDFHYDHSSRDDQRRAFRAQLTIAVERNLPVVIHLREAHEEGIAILEEIGIPTAGCVVHCFTGDEELAKRFLDLGCYISFAGPVTFKMASAIRSAAAAVPLERLLVETDSPFMAPEPHRGRTNEPAWVTLTVERIAEVKGVHAAVVAEACLENALEVFGETKGE